MKNDNTGISKKVIDQIKALAKQHNVRKVVLLAHVHEAITGRKATLTWLYTRGIMQDLHLM